MNINVEVDGGNPLDVPSPNPKTLFWKRKNALETLALPELPK